MIICPVLADSWMAFWKRRVVRFVRPRLAIAIVILILIAPLVASAQPRADQVPRIGVLTFMTTKAFQEGLRQGLREHGYVEGQNIVVEWRSAEGRIDRANTLAMELVRLNVGVIVTEFTPAALAAKNATQTIPIVMAPAGDPVATGLVSSLARARGNITGFTNMAAELSGKRLDLLRELLPRLAHLGVLIQGTDPWEKAFVDENQAAAKTARIQLHVARVARPEDLEAAFSAIVKERAGAMVFSGSVPVPVRQVAQLALRYGLPSLSHLNDFADSGGLMSYGANLAEIQRRAAGHVARILKGAKVADLPVERPTQFDLVINLKTAKALGLTIPQSLLQRADRVIE
jgi:putative ABC transport system substrate-binding protein